MKRKFITTILIGTLITGLLPGCGNSLQENTDMTAQPEETVDEEGEEDFRAAEEAAAKAAEEAAAKAIEEEADTCYEDGRAYLYGLNGHDTDVEMAYINFERALELGKTEANFYLGVIYDWYRYPEIDYERARAYYEAAGDDPYAQLALGHLYYYGRKIGLEEDREKAQELFEAVIAEGCAEGYLGKAEAARTEEDFDTALECYNKVLEGEEQVYIADAMYSIGYMYHFGQGIDPDYPKAMEWYEKAVDLGYSSAMIAIGYMYQNGQGVDQDYPKALEWYDRAANLGNATALSSIGYLYYLAQAYDKAVEWYEKAADLGNSDAINNLAYMYQYGQGIEQDYAKAMEWYTKSVDLGNATSMNNIGYMYENGQGVEQDYATALEWYEKAADLGYAVAMDNIAYLYENGLGVDKDTAKAQEWRDKAKEAK